MCEHLLECKKHPLVIQIGKLQAELKNLKEFARNIIENQCWDLCEPDGGTIQELAEKLGLIVPFIATEQDINDEFGDFEVGDTIFKFSEVLKKE